MMKKANPWEGGGVVAHQVICFQLECLGKLEFTFETALVF
jgi:hypothetical protein